MFRRPKALATKDDEFLQRLRHVMGPELSPSEIFDLCEATRETRMEVVTRIAIKIFGCRVVGGFVRDWIVRGEAVHPNRPPEQWVEETELHGHRFFDFVPVSMLSMLSIIISCVLVLLF